VAIIQNQKKTNKRLARSIETAEPEIRAMVTQQYTGVVVKLEEGIGGAVLNAQACFDQFGESATQFKQRLQLLNFKIHKVPGTGECFWTSVLLGIN